MTTVSAAGSAITNTGAAATLTIGDNNTTSTFGGIISGAALLSLTKIGTGTLTLSGANTYTGATLIRGGTLALSGGTALANAGAVDVGNGAGGAILYLSNFDETIGAFTLNQGTVQSTGGIRTLTLMALN